MIDSRLSFEDAQRTVDEAKAVFFGALGSRGIEVKKGVPDGSGRPLSASRVRMIHRIIEAACWGILEDVHEIRAEVEGGEERPQDPS